MVTQLTVDQAVYNSTTRQYEWDYASPVTFTFEFNPEACQIVRQVDWRQRHSGRNRLKKTRWKGRETVTVKLTGACHTEQQEMDIQRLAMLNCRWRFRNTADVFDLATNSDSDFTNNANTETESRWFICTNVSIARKTGVGGKAGKTRRYTIDFDMCRDATILNPP